jgi:hypothetical protein
MRFILRCMDPWTSCLNTISWKTIILKSDLKFHSVSSSSFAVLSMPPRLPQERTERSHPQDWIIIPSLPPILISIDKNTKLYKPTYLLTYVLFKDAVGFGDYGVSSNTINNWWIWKDMARNESGLIWHSNLAFVWNDLRRLTNTSAKVAGVRTEI